MAGDKPIELNPRTFQGHDGYWWARCGADVVLGPYETQLAAKAGYNEYLRTFDLDKTRGVLA